MKRSSTGTPTASSRLSTKSPFSIRARRLLLEKISPNVPVLSERRKLEEVMEIVNKDYRQLTVQDSLDEGWIIISRYSA